MFLIKKIYIYIRKKENCISDFPIFWDGSYIHLKDQINYPVFQSRYRDISYRIFGNTIYYMQSGIRFETCSDRIWYPKSQKTTYLMPDIISDLDIRQY